MNIHEITETLEKINASYAKQFKIHRDDDWFVLKIQEELGELSAAYLKLTKRARIGQSSQSDLEKNLREEIADVIAMTLLFARHRGIDVEQAIKDKWFQYL